MRMTVLVLVVAVPGCAGGPTSTVITENVSGSYVFHYAPPGGQVVDDTRDAIVFEDPEAAPECCFEIDRGGDRLAITVGNWLAAPTYPSNGACPPVAYARLAIAGIVDGPQTIAIGANANVAMYYELQLADPTHPAEPCPRDAPASDDTALGEVLTLSGQLKLDEMACVDGLDDPGECALQASGSWAIAGTDSITGAGVLDLSGSFVANDQLGTF